jgi:L-iditol 2-dehydrogenase
MDGMRRVVVRGPGDVRVESAAVPTPTAGQLLVAPLRVGVCATDLELIDGSLIYLRTGELRLPHTPGHEWVGQVTDTGSDVTMFAPGDLVVGECSIGCGFCRFCLSGNYHQCPTRRETGIFGLQGALQQRMIFPASAAHRIPEGTSLADAALVEPAAVAYRAVKRLGARTGASVLVVGAGTLGALVAMILVNAGADVAVVDIRADRVDRVQPLGVRAPNEAEEFGYVVDAAGSAASLTLAHHRMEPGATLVVIGLSGQPQIGFAVDRLVVRDQTMIGSIGSPGVWPAVIRQICSGAVRPSWLVTHVFDIARFSAALDLLRGQTPDVGKVMIAPNDHIDDQI